MILFRDVSAAFLKLAVVVIALAFVYPYVVTTIAGALNGGHLPQ